MTGHGNLSALDAVLANLQPRSVGAGCLSSLAANSGAQILAEVSAVAETARVTERAPRFLPDGVDGGVLFRWSGTEFATG